jgi:uncharacterized protein HemX
MEPNFQQNPQINTQPPMPAAPQSNKSSIGSIVGTIIIIALIVLGGLYFWGKHIQESQNAQDALMEIEDSDTQEIDEATAIINISSSDDLSSIEADLMNTNLDSLDAELQ